MYMTFDKVVEGLKGGCRFAREGWNGNNMFIFLVPGSTFAVSRPPLEGIFKTGTEVEYRPHIDMRAADGTIGVWTASQTDILADDWYLVNEV